MVLIAYGINHRTADIGFREKIAVHINNTPKVLKSLLKLEAVNEAVVLSTCNRTEFYSITNTPQNFTQWLNEYHNLTPQMFDKHVYLYQDECAIRHAMRVASGIDSMILGEPQIFGQFKQAYQKAQQVGSVGKQLNRLFQTVFAVSKLIRSHTRIGASPISVAYAGVKLAERIFTRLSQCRVLLIGAGDTIDLTGIHLTQKGCRHIVIANRSFEKARTLAEKMGATAIKLSDISTYLPRADIVVTATSCNLPIVGKGMVETAIKIRKRRPIFMLDLGVPRNVEPQVSQLEDVYLYNVDDLQGLITENFKNRQEAVAQAEAIINIQTQYFMQEMQNIEGSKLIREYRNKVETLKEQELQQALNALKQGKSPELILRSFVNSFANKIAHAPTVSIREAAQHGQDELLLWAKRLLGI